MKGNDFAIEFLTVTIPHYASVPGWREIFNHLATLGVEERTEMLQEMNKITEPIPVVVSEENLAKLLEFVRLSLEDPTMPGMMVKMIDYENQRVKNVSEQEGIA